MPLVPPFKPLGWLADTLIRYDDQSNQKAQITMNGASQADSAFPCDTFFGIINAAATAVDVAPPVAGALALVQLVCSVATGS